MRSWTFTRGILCSSAVGVEIFFPNVFFWSVLDACYDRGAPVLVFLNVGAQDTLPKTDLKNTTGDRRKKENMANVLTTKSCEKTSAHFRRFWVKISVYSESKNSQKVIPLSQQASIIVSSFYGAYCFRTSAQTKVLDGLRNCVPSKSCFVRDDGEILGYSSSC